jgi:pimeloyl-ACP methyl ester carboxylesterase
MIVRSADGTPIAVERIGVGDGPPLVVVPGALSDVASWSACAPLLADGRGVYVVDRRGRGASGDAPAYAVEREIEDVLAVLDGLARPTDLLGHSSGAILALGAAERTPAHLRRLVLYEPPVFIDEDDRIPPDLPERLDALLAEDDEDRALETFLLEGPRTPDPEIEWLRAHQGWPRMLAMVHTVPYDARISQGFGPDLGRLASVRTPTLMLVGSLSPPRMRKGSEAIAASLPDVLVEELEGQAHLAQVLAPDALAAAVLRFLSSG